MRFAIAIAVVLATAFLANIESRAAEKQVTNTLEDDTITFFIGKEKLAVYNMGTKWNKPFIYPLYAEGGVNVLRKIIPTKADQGSSKDGTDHFHHKGVWVSVDSVNDEKLNFWHEEDKIANQAGGVSSGKDGSQSLTVENHWMQGDKPLIKEKTVITFYPNRLITYDISLTAVDKPVTFHDTKEGFFAVRVAHTMRQMQGGRIVNSNGDKGEKDCWGKDTPWVDYHGEVDGKTVGVTLMDHPDNFRKSRYHVRGYGLFGISPFGPKKYSGGKEEESPVTLEPKGKPLKLRYGLLVHTGDEKEGNVAEVYKSFAGEE